jgi:hypothetical protein
MDPGKIGGSNFFPDKSLNPLNKTGSQNRADKKKETSEAGASIVSEENEMGGLFRLPPDKVVKKLGALLEKSLSDPKVEKLITGYKIAPNSRQALAFCTYACIKQLLGSKYLGPDDEDKVLKAIKEEYEENADQSIDPDERKKRRNKRRKENKPKVNAVMALIQESLKNLEKNHPASGSAINPVA